ncbi:MAG: DNA polymerase III subunit gamma/tau [Gemmatimonadales bacterium]
MIALARKYRPRQFADLLVQDHVAAALRGAVGRGRVGHGYLLTGPRGTGKTTAARILAMALNCERRTETARRLGGSAAESGEPCGECQSCERIWSGAATLDVVEIDAASNRGVDDARDLRERAMYAASGEGRHKVYIIDEAHMLTREAWNALLKILEEPPSKVIFVFATTEPHKIASTAAPVLSRLQRFDFRRIGPGAIRERLRQVLALEHLEAEEDALAVIARYADGGMRDALSVLDQCLSFGDGPITAAGVRQVLGLIDDEQYAAILRAVVERDPAQVFVLVEQLVNAGADLAEFMTGAADVLRALLMAESGVEPEGLTDAVRQAIAAARGKLAPGDIVRMLSFLAEAEAGIRRSASARLVVETLLLRWTVMDRIVDLEAIIAGGSGVGTRDSALGTRHSAAGSRGSVIGPNTQMAESRVPSPESRAVVDQPSPERRAPGNEGRATSSFDWSSIAAAARERSPLLAPVLEAVMSAELLGSRLVLWIAPGQEHLAEGLKRKSALVETVAAEHLDGPVTVEVRSGQAGAQAEVSNQLSGKELPSSTLEEIRRQDPVLDAVADELDLEVVEERIPPERHG